MCEVQTDAQGRRAVRGDSVVYHFLHFRGLRCWSVQGSGGVTPCWGERVWSTCILGGSFLFFQQLLGNDSEGPMQKLWVCLIVVVGVFLCNSAALKKKVQTVQHGEGAATPTSPPQSWSVEFSDQTCSLTVLLFKNSDSTCALHLPGHESRLWGWSRKLKSVLIWEDLGYVSVPREGR